LEVITVRAEMVVDHVENNAETAGMAGIDQPLEAIRSAVGMVRRVEVYSVVAPAAFAGKLRDRHELDVSDTQAYEVLQSLNCGIEGASSGEAADVQLVDHSISQGRGRPVLHLPVEPRMIYRTRKSVHAMWLPRRPGVG